MATAPAPAREYFASDVRYVYAKSSQAALLPDQQEVEARGTQPAPAAAAGLLVENSHSNHPASSVPPPITPPLLNPGTGGRADKKAGKGTLQETPQEVAKDTGAKTSKGKGKPKRKNSRKSVARRQSNGGGGAVAVAGLLPKQQSLSSGKEWQHIAKGPSKDGGKGFQSRVKARAARKISAFKLSTGASAFVPGGGSWSLKASAASFVP